MHLFYESIPPRDVDSAKEAINHIIEYAYKVGEDFLIVLAMGLDELDKSDLHSFNHHGVFNPFSQGVYKFPVIIQKHILSFKRVVEYIINGDPTWEETLPPELIRSAEELSMNICRIHLEQLLEIPIT